MKKGIRKKKSRWISLLMAVFIVTSAILPIFPTGKSVFAASSEAGEVTYETTANYQHVIYANGQPLLIVASKDDLRYARLYIDSNGNHIGEEDEEITFLQGDGLLNGSGIYYVQGKGYFLVNTSIYGGSKEGICEYDTNITITGASDLSNAKYTVYAVYGGNKSGTLIGNTSINITGGNVGYVYGGGYSGDVNGNINVFIDTVVKYNVFGGNGNSGKINGNTTLTFGEHTNVSGSIYGGGKTDSNSSIISEVAGSADIIFNGGTAKRIYGGGLRASVVDKVTITVHGGLVTSILASGYGEADKVAEVGEAEIHLDGGTINYVYSQVNQYSKICRDLSIEASGDTFSDTSFYLGDFAENNENKLQNVSVTLKDTQIKTLYFLESITIEESLSITFDNASVSESFYMVPGVLTNVKEATLSYLNCGSKDGKWGSFDPIYNTIEDNENPVFWGSYLNKNKFTNIIFKDSYVNYYDNTTVGDDNGLETYAETLTMDGGALRIMNSMTSQMPQKTIFKNNPLLLSTSKIPLHFNEIPQGTAYVQWLDRDGITETFENMNNYVIVEAPDDTPDNIFASKKSDMGLITTTISYLEPGGWSGKAWKMDALDKLCTCQPHKSSLKESVFAITDKNVQQAFTLKDIYATITSGCQVVEHKGNYPVFTYSILPDKTTISNASISGDQLTVDDTGWVYIQIEQNLNGKVITYDDDIKIIEGPKENTVTFTEKIAEDISFSFSGGDFSTSSFSLANKITETEKTYLTSSQYTKTVEDGTLQFNLKKEYLNSLELGEHKFIAYIYIEKYSKLYPYSYLFTINVVPPTEVENPTIELSKDSFNYDGIKKEPSVVVKNGDVVIPPSEYSVRYEDNINVGSAKVIITDNEGGNYIVNGSATFEIVNNYQPVNGVDYVATLNENGWTNDDFIITANSGYLLSTGNTVDDSWVANFTRTEETDNGSITFYVKNIETGEISLAVTQEYKIDKTSPQQYDITFNKNSVKQLINAISFGLFFNENIDVEIMAEDSLSGIDDIVYFKSETVLTEEQLNAIAESDWVSDKTFSITAEDKENFIIYVKVTDKAENTICFASNGVVFDLIPPVITGVKNGEVYYTTQSVTVEDENIDSITLNGKNVSSNISLIGNIDETYEIKAIDKAKNETVIKVTMKPIQSLIDFIKNITEENVTSDYKDSLLSVGTINMDTVEGTQEEKDELEAIVNKCNQLLKKIDEVQKEVEQVENTVNSYDIAEVTLANKPAIEALIQNIEVLSQSNNLTEKEKSAVDDLKAVADKLIERITTVQEIFDAKEIKAVEEITENTVKSSDKEALENAKNVIEATLKEYEKNYTEEEKQKLQTINDTCNQLLEKIDEVQKEVEQVKNTVKGYDIAEVTLTNKPAIEALIQNIEVLSQLSNLTEKEKSAVDDLKAVADKLIERITTVQEIFDAKEIKAVEEITENTVKSSDKEALENAKNVIEATLKEYEKNYTEEEKQKLQTINDTCNQLLEKIDEVQKEVEQVKNTVNNYDIAVITSSNKPAIETLIQNIKVLSQSNNLTEEEKSTVDDLKTVADKLIERITTVQEIFDAKEIKAVEEITENTVKSSDKEALENAKNVIEATLKEYEKNYTEEEKQKLQTINDTCNQLLEKIDEVQKEVEQVKNTVNNYDIAVITSSNKPAIETLIQNIKVLSQSNNLTEEEKSTVDDLKTVADKLIERITTVQEIFDAKEIKAVEEITENTVKSSDKEALENAKNVIEATLKEYEKNYTEEEKQKLQTINDTCNQLLEKIDEVQKEVEQVKNTVNNYDIAVITSSNKPEIEALIKGIDALVQSTNLTEEEINAVNDLKTTATKLMEAISTAQAALNAEEIKAVENITETTVNSSDNVALEKAKGTIESILKEYGNHYTEKEKQDLQNISAVCDKLLAKVAEVQKEFVRIETAINQYDIEVVTSNDTSKIEVLIQDIDVLLQSSNLTKEEINVANDLKTTATKLMETISTAQAALNVEEIKAVDGISKDNIKLTDKEALEKAKIALESALNKYNNHYTEKEKQEITASVTCIAEALECIQKIQTTIDFISKLPSANSVSPDDIDIEVLAKKANDMLELMTEYEKSFVDTKNLEAIWKSLVDYKILEGDGSKWIKETNGSMVFKANGSVQKLNGIFIDEKLVDKENYTIKEGSTIITLKESYLNTLSVGNHHLTIHYLDGKTSAAFEIEASLSDDENKKPDDTSKPEDENKKPDTSQPEDETKKPDSSQSQDENQNLDAPQSGDKNNFLLWITLFFISSFGVVGKIVYNIKKR